MLDEHDRIVLNSDLGLGGLRAGDVGTIVHVYKDRTAFEVEFLALDGHTVAVTTVLPSQLRPVGPADITHARELARSSPESRPRTG